MSSRVTWRICWKYKDLGSILFQQAWALYALLSFQMILILIKSWGTSALLSIYCITFYVRTHNYVKRHDPQIMKLEQCKDHSCFLSPCCCSVAKLYLTQHTRLPCLSLAARVCSNSCPLSQWCHPTISSSVTPFSSCHEIKDMQVLLPSEHACLSNS